MPPFEIKFTQVTWSFIVYIYIEFKWLENLKVYFAFKKNLKEAAFYIRANLKYKKSQFYHYFGDMTHLICASYSL